MSETLSGRIQLLCAWSGIAFVVFYGLTFIVLGHNYPPPDPGFSAQELVDNFYMKYRHEILLGESGQAVSRGQLGVAAARGAAIWSRSQASPAGSLASKRRKTDKFELET
jgi:hypothetical protein